MYCGAIRGTEDEEGLSSSQCIAYEHLHFDANAHLAAGLCMQVSEQTGRAKTFLMLLRTACLMQVESWDRSIATRMHKTLPLLKLPTADQWTAADPNLSSGHDEDTR